MFSNKRTKIVATIGPSTKSKEVLKKMILEGVNVFRINFSHANYKVVKENISLVRKLSEELETNIAILADLQGPKLRIGLIEDNTIIHYYMDSFFEDNIKTSYSGFRYDDEIANVKWPKKPKIISEKDKNYLKLNLKDI